MSWLLAEVVRWWVLARIYESALDHQGDPEIHRWLYTFATQADGLV